MNRSKTVRVTRTQAQVASPRVARATLNRTNSASEREKLKAATTTSRPLTATQQRSVEEPEGNGMMTLLRRQTVAIRKVVQQEAENVLDQLQHNNGTQTSDFSTPQLARRLTVRSQTGRSQSAKNERQMPKQLQNSQGIPFKPTQSDVELIRKSWLALSDDKTELGIEIFESIFDQDGNVKKMFSTLTGQGKKKRKQNPHFRALVGAFHSNYQNRGFDSTYWNTFETCIKKIIFKRLNGIPSTKLRCEHKAHVSAMWCDFIEVILKGMNEGYLEKAMKS